MAADAAHETRDVLSNFDRLLLVPVCLLSGLITSRQCWIFCMNTHSWLNDKKDRKNVITSSCSINRLARLLSSFIIIIFAILIWFSAFLCAILTSCSLEGQKRGKRFNSIKTHKIVRFDFLFFVLWHAVSHLVWLLTVSGRCSPVCNYE